MKKILVCIVILIAIFYQGSSKQIAPLEQDEQSQTIEITVEGAVKVEGVYTIIQGNMEELLNSVELESNADVACINYDRLLYHGDLVYIPFEGEKVSLNNATQEELMSIKGIGKKKSQSIIDGRPYESIEQITKVSGIGNKSYLKWREYLCL